MTVPVAQSPPPMPPAPTAEPVRPVEPLPVVIDLDGTLTAVDTLHESFFRMLFEAPPRIFGALRALAGGRAAFKRYIFENAPAESAAIPLRQDLIRYLGEQKGRGVPLHLVTAADQSIADAVALRTGLFDSATGSDGRGNLKGEAKRRHLEARFPEGFIYAGDSRADLCVWRSCRRAILVGNGMRHERGLALAGVGIVARFPNPSPSWLHWLGLFRPDRWWRVLMAFLPLLLVDAWPPSAGAVRMVLAGSMLLILTISGLAALEGIATLDLDRVRERKPGPLADCSIPVTIAFLAGVMLIAAGWVGATMLSRWFGLVVLAYTGLGLGRTVFLRGRRKLDAMIGAGLLLLPLLGGFILI